MILLIPFAFLAGIVTIVSPCVLPILPIILSGGLESGKKRPLGIVTGFVLSFTFFTLGLSAVVKATGLSSDTLRNVSIVVILILGWSLLVPRFQIWMKHMMSLFSKLAPKNKSSTGFGGGVLLGLSLGLIWTPCVGPILASVITLAATSSVSASGVFITLAYSVGAAIPMVMIVYGGKSLLQKVPWLLRNTGKIQKIFGVIMILTAMGIFFGIDRKFQVYVLKKFPNYGAGLTKFETSPLIQKQLQQLQKKPEFLSPPSEGGVPKQSDGRGGAPAASIVENRYPLAPELITGNGQWFNSPPLKISELRGKVVLIDFWTYTCINCIRTLPYLQSWHKKYADKGLVIIGVHTPEFEFEKKADNVAKAIKDFGLTYPVVQDNDYATWNAYENHYWPAKYFIDKNGRIRSSHFGEGEYDESEKWIQRLLKETGANVDGLSVNNKRYSVDTQSPESYLGYGRLERFASPETIKNDETAAYSAPANLPLNQMAYEGPWTLMSEDARPEKNSSLLFHFKSREVYLVMRSYNGSPGQVKVFLDGKPIATGASGEDAKNGVITVQDDRLYKLVKLPDSEDHTLKLEFLDSNLALYAFTFG